ncbi:MAG: hypothetical protein JWM73_2820 [Solirubrobacterales bacterium]|nr:hypothetical protein [Solirubrobacterales bacterium]
MSRWRYFPVMVHTNALTSAPFTAADDDRHGAGTIGDEALLVLTPLGREALRMLADDGEEEDG